jgi:hypothetical protein
MDAPPVHTLAHQHPRPARTWLILPAIIATTVTAISASKVIAQGTGYTAVMIWWVASLALVLLATLPSIPSRASLAAWLKTPPFRAWFPWLAMIAIAAVPRLVLLDRFPTVLDGDESAFIIRAVAFRQGNLPDWFGISFYGNANSWSVAQGLVADLVGTGAASHRTLNALTGAIGVIATWRLGRHIVGEPAAALGAILLAAWPLHLQLSRIALNNITDPTAFALALLFLVRTVTTRRPIDAVACGLSLALGLYGYYGGRAFPVVILTILVVLALRYRLGIRETGRLLAWITFAFVAATMPLLATFQSNPNEFGSHMDMVSPFTLTNLRNSPVDTIRLYLPNLWKAIAYPFAGNDVGYFRYGPPYFGWPLCILITIGTIALMISLYRSRDIAPLACLAIPWLLLTAGVATTYPIAGQRFLALTPVFAITAGLGLWSVVSIVTRFGSFRLRRWPEAIAVIAAAILAINHLTWIASEDRQVDTYADRRTIAAWDLGWRLSRNPSQPPPTVYFAGAPFVWSQSFPSLTFLTDGLAMTDLDTPLESPASVPPLPPGTILILIPERSAERCIIEAAIPGVRVIEVLSRDNTTLYYVYSTELPLTFSIDPTPGETVTAHAAPATC